ncbi:MAG: PNGase F N-terminal domain-containing protein [Reichenbachiella sp.]|uniref:peptide-N-glycosidase F-related protein n=1 Tax=Reichenbachiella sp. TaxID=2184521 RepID=UPI003266FF43
MIRRTDHTHNHLNILRSMYYGLVLVILFGLSACDRTYIPSGDYSTRVFESVPINFNGKESDDTQVIRLESGRLALKKLQLPNFEAGAEVFIRVTVRSAGDRWDKSGSCFFIQDTTQLSLLQSGDENFKYPAGSSVGEKFGGVKVADNFAPAVELMRFMTPFGVGFYSEEREDDHRKPVYVPRWEKEVVWEADISDFYQALADGGYIGIWIDSWTKEGYEASVDIDVRERYLSRKKIVPLANTVYYGKGQSIPEFFADGDFEIDFNVEQPLKNVELKYITTGHGGHSGGDEFVKTKNSLYLDGKQILDTIPWRDDCASFRRFNPSSGVWLIEDSASYIDWEAQKYKVKYIEERQASSDLSRSNWCPGSYVEPYTISLGDLSAGGHQLKISIPAQPMEENKFNHWLVSAYLVYESDIE